jgi:16S rRNA (guanine966-N2)-methyltransferase
MRLRIISGQLKGRYLTVPPGVRGFRPTLERHRESIAQILYPRLPGARAADLCAGSGAMGFEMLSRGAEHVDFVESNVGRARFISDQAGKLGVHDRCRVRSTDLRQLLGREGPLYDVIFFDPPYADDSLADLLPELFLWVAAGGILVYEHGRERPSRGASAPGGVSLADTRQFGAATMDLYVRASEETAD